MPEIPRCNRRRITPQSNALETGCLLSLGIKAAVSRQLIPVILLVMPGQACLDLLKIDVLAIQQHFSQDTLIAVLFGPLHRNFLAKDEISQVLPGHSTKWLLALGLIDAYQSYLVLPV